MRARAIPIYADTSVYGGVFDLEFEIPSREFFKQVEAGRFHLVISPVIEREIADAPIEVKEFTHHFLETAEIMPISAECLRLQEAYLQARIVSRTWEADALHVAYAVVSRCRVIVSWNFRHIVHFDKIRLYNAISALHGYSTVDIHSPQEVIEYEEEDV